MDEDFVSYDLAIKLKEKGFKEKCVAFYHIDNLEVGLIQGQVRITDQLIVRLEDVCTQFNLSNDDRFFDAPTISQVLKWLREEKSLHVEIVSAAYGYIYIVSDTPNKGGTDRVNSRYRGRNDGGAWDDYNECVLDAIEYVIDNLL